MTRVLIVDDHASVRELLREALAPAGYAVVGEASDGEEAVRLAAELCPDVVVMDVTMPGCDGLDATEMLAKSVPNARVVIWSHHEHRELIAQATRAGAAGYAPKGKGIAHLYETIRRVATGERLLSSQWADGVLAEVDEELLRRSLTRREREVLQLRANGDSNRAVAERLFISPKSVRRHLSAGYAKLDVSNLTEAVVEAARLGIITLPSSIPSV